MRRLLVAGGRDTFLNTAGLAFLDQLHCQYKFTELVNGMATGVDECARGWAMDYDIPIKEFFPNWSLGKKGGILRNKAMAAYCSKGDFCVLFFGNRGTASMLVEATERGMNVIDLREREDLIT